MTVLHPEFTAALLVLTGLFFRLLPYQVLLIVINAVNGIVDSLYASNGISEGNAAMSAIGLFGPLNHLLYAMSIAKKYMASHARLEDLFQAGCEGLVIAAHKYDASLGCRFISYATWYVENEVRKAAYDYIKHDIASLNEPINAEEADGDNIRRGKDQ